MKLFALFGFLMMGSAHAEMNPGCFDLSKPNLTPLHAAPTKFESGNDPSDFGTDEKNNDWGQVSGIVKHPIGEIYKRLLDPKTIRNGANTKVDVTEIKTKDFLKKIVQKIVVKPVFFVTIDWKEDWAYSLKDGTEKDPKSILISYQKTEGTAHIKHLCGNILIQKLKPDSTGVYLYEEVQADRRSAEDVAKGIIGTLRTLRD